MLVRYFVVGLHTVGQFFDDPQTPNLFSLSVSGLLIKHCPIPVHITIPPLEHTVEGEFATFV